jgi:hypothetical protein
VRGCTRDDPVGGASWGRGDIPEHWPIATLSSSGKYVCRTFTTVNAVVLAGSVAADPVQRRMPSGDGVTHVRLSNDPVEWSRFRLRGGSTEDASVPRKPPSASLLRLLKFTCFVVCLGLSDLSRDALESNPSSAQGCPRPRRVSNQDHPSHETYPSPVFAARDDCGEGIAKKPSSAIAGSQLRGVRQAGPHITLTIHGLTELRISVPEAGKAPPPYTDPQCCRAPIVRPPLTGRTPERPSTAVLSCIDLDECERSCTGALP